ncbi:MAG: EcsC family protein [Bacteroidales bacterium]
MKNPLNHFAIIKSLDWAYEKALDGVPGLDSSFEMAEKYLKQEGSLQEKANSLIRWQNAKAATSGFLTGIGGFITLPVAIPANLASVLYIQIRMVAAIAHMGGYNLRDDKVKTLVYLCLAGNFAKDFLQEAGIRLGTQLTAKLVTNISEKSLLLINQKIGFRLLSTYSGKGIFNLSKAVPLAGGIIGGSIDIIATNIIGNTARNIFLPSYGRKPNLSSDIL